MGGRCSNFFPGQIIYYVLQNESKERFKKIAKHLTRLRHKTAEPIRDLYSPVSQSAVF